MGKEKRVYLSVTNDLVGDQRLHRVCSALREAGYRPTLIGRRLPGSGQVPERAYATRRFKLPFHRGKLFYVSYNLRLLVFLLGQKRGIFVANDLDTLAAVWFASRLKGCPLVYDTHEYFTEVPELIDRPRTRAIWLWLERRIFPRLKYVYTVNESLAAIYHRKYRVPVRVVRNVPFRRRLTTPPVTDPRILLYQGALNLGRGIELMIDAMEYLPAYTLCIVGRGDIEDSLRARAKQNAQITFMGFVPFDQLPAYTQKATLGFSLEEDMGENYRIASPNKVYDYIQDGVPVLVSDLPEMRRLVAEWHVGEWLPVEARSPQALAKRVRAMVESPERYQSYRDACARAAEKLNWERERGTLLGLYQEVADHFKK